MEQLKNRIREYASSLFSVDEQTIGVQIDMLIERTQAYLNRDDIDIKLAGTLATILYENNLAFERNKQERVQSVKLVDQSVSFFENSTQSLINANDVALFGAHTSILNRFRKVGVINRADR